MNDNFSIQEAKGFLNYLSSLQDDAQPKAVKSDSALLNNVVSAVNTVRENGWKSEGESLLEDLADLNARSIEELSVALTNQSSESEIEELAKSVHEAVKGLEAFQKKSPVI